MHGFRVLAVLRLQKMQMWQCKLVALEIAQQRATSRMPVDFPRFGICYFFLDRVENSIWNFAVQT